MAADPALSPRFGDFGGRYVPETLVGAHEELERAYEAARADPGVTAHGRPAEAQFWYPNRRIARTRVTVRSLDPERLGEVQAKLAEVARGIAAEDWPTRPGGHCDRCRVRLVCPAWPDGQEAYSR